MLKEYKKAIIRIAVAAILFIIGFVVQKNIAKLVLYLSAYAVIGYDILFKAVRNIMHGQVFDENFLMCLATIGAFAIGEYPEGVAVMLFYQIGELFQDYAVNRSRQSIAALMDIRPDFAWVLRDGEYVKISPDEINIGDTILVKAGEKISIDGVVIEGSTTIDTSTLTGESIPRDLSVNDYALSGSVNLSGTIKIRAEKDFDNSTVSKILELVENAGNKKAKVENFITKFARYYTPTVVIGAVLLAFIPPIFLGNLAEWVHRALIFLVVSCPCALVISIPLGFFGGIGGASKTGILIKGSCFMEVLSKVETVVFDKTGTLTKGKFVITEIKTNGISEEELIDICAHAEAYSNHPLSRAVVERIEKIDYTRINEAEEIAGHGIKAIVDGKEVLCGNAKLMQLNDIIYEEYGENAVIYVSINNQYAGYIALEDEIKDDAVETIKALKECGIGKTVILTGDTDSVGKKVAQTVGADEVYTGLLPADKVTALEKIIKNKTAGSTVAYVGDGINDAPVLARADVGIAMGGLGSDAAIEVADVVIMTDEPKKLIDAIAISQKTLKIVKQNIVLALTVKALVLILGAIGVATMWSAVFADVGVAVIAILNSVRTLNYKA